MKAKVITSFVRYSDSDLETKGRIIIDSCTNNPNFTIPAQYLTKANDSLTSYSKSLKASESRDKVAVAQKNIDKKEVQDILQKVAIEVNLQCDGDLPKLLSSNIPLAGASHLGKLKITSLDVKVGERSGEAEIIVGTTDVTHNGATIAWTEEENAPEDKELWKQKYIKGSKYTIKGLSYLKKYLVTAAYNGNDGEELNWAKPIDFRPT